MNFISFREPELEQLIQSNQSAEWNAIVSRLSMKGQVEDSKNELGIPNPYQRLNSRWVKIFKTICRSSADYQKYNFSTIPLDALREIEFAVNNKFFRAIQIWYDEVEKDPFIIGVAGESFTPKHYLIGQFGEEVLPHEELEIKAIQRLTLHVENNLNLYKSNISKVVNDYLDHDVDSPLIDPTTAHGRIIFV